MRTMTRLLAGVALMTAAAMPVRAQKMSASDLARSISGTWTLDLHLTSTMARPASGGRGGGVMPAALFQERFPQGIRANPTNTEPTSSKDSDMTPAERAERSALMQLQQVQPTLSITASVEQVTIADDRGDASCAVNGRSDKIRTFGTYMDVKCKWDKDQLRQEFSTARTRVIRAWSVDGKGHLVLKLKREGINQDATVTTTVYDRS